MRILVINSGSSSLKFSVYGLGSSDEEPSALCDGAIEGLGSGAAEMHLSVQGSSISAEMPAAVNTATKKTVLPLVLDALRSAEMAEFEAIGYRVVHPGPHIHRHRRLTTEVLKDLEAAAALAPLHDPAIIALIRESMNTFPGIAHFACFDTVFHETMPEEASRYALPQKYSDKGIRRYGFHGLSCESVVRKFATSPDGCPKRLVIAHLGSGCSVTALSDGQSVDTTMGLTPTGGVVMGTRPGDLDPGLVLYLLRQESGDRNVAASSIEQLLNYDSGLVALSAMPNDVRAIRKAAKEGDSKAKLALKVFTRSITKAIGAYSWLLGGLDGIVFTGGIGEHDGETRLEVLAEGSGQGILIDTQQNAGLSSGIHRITESESSLPVFVVPADENRMIAIHVAQMAISDIIEAAAVPNTTFTHEGNL